MQKTSPITSFVLYRSYWNSIRTLSMEQRGLLLTAIYAQIGVEPMPTLDPATNMAFLFIKDQLERDQAKWDDVRRKRAAAGKKGGKARAAKYCDLPGEANASFANQSLADQAVDVDGDVTGDGDADEDETIISPTITMGKFNRVVLTAEAYDALVAEYGESEVTRAVGYVDESAQATNNRNGWSDWAVVIRRCIREGWGRRSDGAEPKPARRLINGCCPNTERSQK